MMLKDQLLLSISNNDTSQSMSNLMSDTKWMLSFALNPATNSMEYISIPIITHSKSHEMASSRQVKHKTNSLSSTKQHQPLTKDDSGKKEEQSEIIESKQVNKDQRLNDMLSSLILSTLESTPTFFQSKLSQVLQLGKETSMDQLVMMDYTQKLSYLRQKCHSRPFLVSHLSQEITRVTEHLFQEQERYYSLLCSEWIPDFCRNQ